MRERSNEYGLGLTDRALKSRSGDGAFLVAAWPESSGSIKKGEQGVTWPN